MHLSARDDLLEHGDREGGALGVLGPHDLRSVFDREALVARVDALRREGQVEVDARPEPGALQDRPEHLVGRAGERGALEDDQVARA